MSTMDETAAARTADDVRDPHRRPVDPPPATGLARALWAERWAVLGCVIVAALAGGLLGQLQTPQYTARSRVFLAAQADFDPLGRVSAGDVGRFVENQVALMGSTSVLAATIKALELDSTPTELAERVRLAARDNSTVITVRATAATPQEAKDIADALPDAYRQSVRQRVAEQTEAADVAAAAAKDPTTAAAVQTARAVYGDGVATVEKAALPKQPSSPQPVRNAVLLGLLGLVVGTGYALYTQSAVRRRVGPAEAAALVDAPLLGHIPDRGRVTEALAQAASDAGDAYRMAAVGLDYIRGSAPGVFLVSAPHDGAGTSLTALNLAAAAADHGRKVFLFDVEDSVRPPAESVGAPRVPLHDLALGRVDLGMLVERHGSRLGIIRLLVQRPVQAHPVADVQQILEQLPDDTDLVLFDAPPLSSSSAAFALAGQVDAAVVVADDATTPADLDEMRRRCRLAGIPVAGVLMNHVRPHPGEAGRRRREPALDLMTPEPRRSTDLSGWGTRPASLMEPGPLAATPIEPSAPVKTIRI
jgi:tyrosine-protein kinase